MTEKYKSKFEVWIRDRYPGYAQFAREIGASLSSVSKWVNGTAFPDPKAIRSIWALTKDEIGPMYWYKDWPSEMRLRHESIKLLHEQKRTRNSIKYK